MTQTTEVTSKDMVDAMEAVRAAKTDWEFKKDESSVASSNECRALNNYNDKKKKFEELMKRIMGEMGK